MRADAVRNHRLVLDAAARLITEHGSGYVSLDRVAEAAGVGKGTVVRRFGSRAGLLRALLEHRADAIRADVAGTAGPLGSDAPPLPRLLAFLSALAALAADNANLLAEHEQACAADRYSDPSYQRWHHHLTGLIAQINPALDDDAVAHLLLATIDGRLVRRLDRAGAEGRFEAALATTVRAALLPDDRTDQGRASSGATTPSTTNST